jgi:hypothetical protein
MKTLNLPEYKFNLQKRKGKLTIFDPIRKKYVILTPEEWVRQHFLHYLIEYLSFPRSLIKVETGLSYNQLQKRSDILIYNRSGKPVMIIECKSFEIKIGQNAFDQAAMYNHTLSAPYLVITNGMEHWCCKIEDSGIHFLKDIPNFNELEES